MDRSAYEAIVQRNARRWEAMAAHRRGMPVAEFRAGVSPLWPEELALLGDLRGKRVLHLACAVCDEGIAMAMQGAQVTGVDIAETHIRTGREKAAELGVAIDLRVGNMMQLDDDFRDVDLAYISSGGICWIPDLDDWLAGVRMALRPDGRLLIMEHHPLWETLGVIGERQLTVLRDYFERRSLPALPGPAAAKAAIGVAQTAGDDNVLHSYVWGIGAVVSALLRNGFRIAALQEFPDSPMYGGLGDASDCIPSVYLLMAERA